jgi:hypothetical protein
MDINTLREYINIHKISLYQDWDDAKNGVPTKDDEHYEADEYYIGAIETCLHLLEVLDER